ncbi:MAG TPA: hypothetical protein VIT21_03545 [Chthoniobacterales bacterium]
MKTFTIPLPILGLLSGTRVIAGAGLALILADKLDRESRKAVGWTLLIIGLATTVPLVAFLFSTCEEKEKSEVVKVP